MTTLRLALRYLRRSPTFAVGIVVPLALAIGACTAVFSVMQALFLTPVPYPEPDRLVEVWSTPTPSSLQRVDAVAAERVRDWLGREFRSLEGLAARGPTALVIEGDVPRRVDADAVSGNFFDLVGGSARQGRTLAPADDLPGADPAIVISERLFDELRGDRQDLLGVRVRLSGTTYTIVGVMPAAFDAGRRIWLPAWPRLVDGQGVWFPVGRLRTGVAFDEAVLEIQQRAAVEHAADSTLHGGMGAVVVPFARGPADAEGATIWLLGGTVGVVFFLALSNLTTFFLVRAADRARGAALRIALGASTFRIGADLLVQAALLAVLGAGLGLGLAVWGKELVRAVLGDGLEGVVPSLDPYTFGFAATLALVAAVSAGLEPMRHLRTLDVRGLLQTGGAAITSGPSRHRTRVRLLGLQVALTAVLATAVGILAVAHQNYLQVDVGFEAERVVAAFADYEVHPMAADEQVGLGAAAAARVAQAPGVESATYWRPGGTTWPPRPGQQAVFEDGVPAPKDRTGLYGFYDVGPAFFQTMGIRITAGRDFGPQDTPGSPLVGIVSEGGARAWWTGEDAIGKRLKLGETGEWITVVGTAEDSGALDQMGQMFAFSPRPRTPRHLPRLFRPMAQRPAIPELWDIDSNPSFRYGVAVGARVADRSATAATTMVDAFAGLAPRLPLAYVGTLDEYLASAWWIARLRLYRTLVAVVAAIGMIIALLGIAGVVADGIGQRTREIGVRKALGASPLRIQLLVARSSILPSMVGLGAAMALIISLGVGVGELDRYYQALLGGASLLEWRVLLLVATSILAVASVSALLFARRATRVTPAEALRVD